MCSLYFQTIVLYLCSLLVSNFLVVQSQIPNCTDLQEDGEALKVTNTKLQTSLSNLQQSYQLLEKHNANLQQAFNNSQSTHANLQQINTLLQETNINLHQSLASLQQQFTQLAQTLHDCNNDYHSSGPSKDWVLSRTDQNCDEACAAVNTQCNSVGSAQINNERRLEYVYNRILGKNGKCDEFGAQGLFNNEPLVYRRLGTNELVCKTTGSAYVDCDANFGAERLCCCGSDCAVE